MNADEERARAAMRGRGAGRCEICLSPDSVQASHRDNRSQGGLWRPPGILGLCYACHDWWTHHPDYADLGGWILKRHVEDITQIPVWLNSAGLRPGWWLLDDNGDATPQDCEDPPTFELFPPHLPAGLVPYRHAW